jgi:hypothetical protein
MLKKGVRGVWVEVETQIAGPGESDPLRKIAAAVLEKALKDYATGIELLVDPPDKPDKNEVGALRIAEESKEFLLRGSIFHEYIDIDTGVLANYISGLEEQVIEGHQSMSGGDPVGEGGWDQEELVGQAPPGDQLVLSPPAGSEAYNS